LISGWVCHRSPNTKQTAISKRHKVAVGDQRQQCHSETGEGKGLLIQNKSPHLGFDRGGASNGENGSRVKTDDGHHQKKNKVGVEKNPQP